MGYLRFDPAFLIACRHLAQPLSFPVTKIIGEFRPVLPGLAARADATSLPRPEMARPFPIDRICASAMDSRASDRAVMRGASQVCGSEPQR
jgi:hypothetical protein